MTSDVTLATAIEQQSQTSVAQASLAEDFTQFLTLLTVQLQNQDPMSPMDSTEFTNQLVAFTQVEQSINTNEKLDSLVALGVSDGLSSAQSYVGNDISYVSSEFYFDGSPQDMRYSLSSEAASATMRIYNEDGAVVYEEDVSTMSGAHEISWDGRLTGGGLAKDGTYEIVIDALDQNGDSISATTVVTGQVQGVESQNGQIYLLVGERAVSLSNVLNSQLSSNNASMTDSVTSALNYVGMDVSYDSNEFLLGTDGVADLQYTLPQDVERAKIHIYDDQGKLVFTDDTDTSKGLNTYQLETSSLSAGEYTFEIDAITRGTATLKDQTVTYTDTEEMNIAYTLQNDYDSVALEIQDSSGNVVYTDSLKRSSGAHSYSWDGTLDGGGTAESGDYQVVIKAVDNEDTSVSSSSSVSGRVTGVEVDNGVVFLQIGPTTSIPLSEINSVSVPQDNTSEEGAA